VISKRFSNLNSPGATPAFTHDAIADEKKAAHNVFLIMVF
jgi:hypothetical protein